MSEAGSNGHEAHGPAIAEAAASEPMTPEAYRRELLARMEPSLHAYSDMVTIAAEVADRATAGHEAEVQATIFDAVFRHMLEVDRIRFNASVMASVSQTMAADPMGGRRIAAPGGLPHPLRSRAGR